MHVNYFRYLTKRVTVIAKQLHMHKAIPALNFRHSPTPFGCCLSHCWFVRYAPFSSPLILFYLSFRRCWHSWCHLRLRKIIYLQYIYFLVNYSIHTPHAVLHACIQAIVKCAQHRCERYVSAGWVFVVMYRWLVTLFHHTRDSAKWLSVLCIYAWISTQSAHDGGCEANEANE